MTTIDLDDIDYPDEWTGAAIASAVHAILAARDVDHEDRELAYRYASVRLRAAADAFADAADDAVTREVAA